MACTQIPELCSCPEGVTGESPGWNPGDHTTQSPPCPERVHGTGWVWSPFAPLGRDVMGWRDPGFRSAPPRAVSVRRFAAGAGAGWVSGGGGKPVLDPAPGLCDFEYERGSRVETGIHSTCDLLAFPVFASDPFRVS